MYTKKDLFKLIVPLIVEQILSVLVGMADVIMVAAIGEAAVSGVSLVDSINILLIQLLAALATGGAVIASQYLGKKDQDKACQSANQLLLVTLLISLGLMIISLTGNSWILSTAFGKVDKLVMYNARIYFYITAISYPFLAIYNSCAALTRSMGNSAISMKAAIIMNIINVLGNAICVYGLRMGVEGVAIPTLISRVVAAVIMIFVIRNPKHVIHIDPKFKLGYHPAMIKRILHIGIPNGLENSMFQFGKIVIQSLVSSLGTVAIAGFAVSHNIVMLEYLPGNALGLALITIVGQCVGAGEYDQAAKYTKKIIAINYGLLAVICTTLIVVAKPLASIYNLSSEATSITVTMVVFHSICMLIWPPSFTLPNALRAASDVKYTMIISIVSMWAFRIILSYILVKVFDMGVIAVWIAMMVDWFVRAIFFSGRFIRGKWKTKAL